MSYERRDGFLKTLISIKNKWFDINNKPPEEVKQTVLDEINEDIDIYSGMVDTEDDYASKKILRGPRKFLLNPDGSTYRRNPDWVDNRPDWLKEFFKGGDNG